MRALKKFIGVAIILLLISLAIVGCSYLPVRLTIIPDSPTPRYLYDSLIFEISATKGNEPDFDALQHFRSKLEEFGICRTECVFFIPKRASIEPTGLWSLATLYQFEALNRDILDQDPEDRVGVIFVPYAKGMYLTSGGKTKQLGGIQYSRSSFAIFLDGARDREAGVLLHEFAHIIGICKKNKKPKAHCKDRNCVMYPSTGSPYAVFCKKCEKELARIIKKRAR